MTVKSNSKIDDIKKRFNHLEPIRHFFETYGVYGESVFLFEGDLHVSELSLEYFEDKNMPSTIIVIGSLNVDGAIWNREIDYGINLLIVGDLKAKNIAAAGQIISVWGNVIVENILCGSYNHGSMYVKGNIHAEIIIADDYEMGCFGNFKGVKVGDGNFKDLKTDNYLEPDYADWDMILEEDILDENGFSYDKYVECIRNNIPISYSQPHKNYDFLSFLQPIITSYLIPKSHPYFLKLLSQKLEANQKSLILETDFDASFRYALQENKVNVEKIDDNTFVRLEFLPPYFTRKAFRLLKLANNSWFENESRIQNRLTAIPDFFNLWDRLLDFDQRKSIGKRIELALKNPAWYFEIYQKDCDKRGNPLFYSRLYVSAFVDAMVEMGVAISIDEKLRLEDAKNALIGLIKFNTIHDELALSHIKWGRKLFTFSHEVLSLNTAIPANAPFEIRLFRHYPNEIVFFLVDRKPFLDKAIKDLFRVFDLAS
ncbi:MAG: hypothetical protein JNL70_18875 [Saprospiraceae bacterium]|nr:hypothetical protein [Saprospiraceae bacterium]